MTFWTKFFCLSKNLFPVHSATFLLIIVSIINFNIPYSNNFRLFFLQTKFLRLLKLFYSFWCVSYAYLRNNRTLVPPSSLALHSNWSALVGRRRIHRHHHPQRTQCTRHTMTPLHHHNMRRRRPSLQRPRWQSKQQKKTHKKFPRGCIWWYYLREHCALVNPMEMPVCVSTDQQSYRHRFYIILPTFTRFGKKCNLYNIALLVDTKCLKVEMLGFLREVLVGDR